jgi:chromosomal replication initiator protein
MTNIQDYWPLAYQLLQETIVEAQLRLWIQPLKPLRVTAEEDSSTNQRYYKVTLQAAQDFSAQWVRDHFKQNIEAAFTRVIEQPCKVEIIVEDGFLNSSPNSSSTTPTASLDPSLETLSEPSSDPLSSPFDYSVPKESLSTKSTHRSPFGTTSTIEPKYTFESFIVGSSNQFAHASALAVAENPGRQYNPLFLYSPPGLGKTHLLHAIANHVLQKNNEAKVAYLSAELFVNDLVDSIQHKKMSQFRSKYRNSFDLILIDDIQFIAGKKQTEEEFFHTFNELHASKRQIVVTSDRPPKEIEGLEERIRTRFEWGLVADISPPEIETRIAILKAKAERDDIYLPDDVANFIATYVKSNVRELEGLLVKLQAHASLTGAEITLDLAKQQLKISNPVEDSHYTIEQIQTAIIKHFGIKSSDLKSTSRSRKFARPRQIAMYLIRKYTGMGYKEIGSYFGGKDHSTIIHACQLIETSLNEGDEEIRQSVEAIQNLL